MHHPLIGNNAILLEHQQLVLQNHFIYDCYGQSRSFLEDFVDTTSQSIFHSKHFLHVTRQQIKKEDESLGFPYFPDFDWTLINGDEMDFDVDDEEIDEHNDHEIDELVLAQEEEQLHQLNDDEDDDDDDDEEE
jgi:hypothetical protein